MDIDKVLVTSVAAALVLASGIAFAEESCFRIARSRTRRGSEGIFFQRPKNFPRGGRGIRNYLVLDHRRSASNSLGRSIRKVKLAVTRRNKFSFARGRTGVLLPVGEITSLLQVAEGSPAICVNWEASRGSQRLATSADVCFRIGGNTRGLNGTRAGTLGICESSRPARGA